MTGRLSHPAVPWIAAGLAVLLCLPALGAGFNGDDYFHRAIIGGVDTFAQQANPLMDLFVFVPDGPRKEWMLESGFLPWWTHPDVTIGFLRPLTAATHLADHALWAETPWLHHLHSLLWFLLAVGLVGTLYRQVMGAVPAAGLAALLFAVEDAHVMPAGWLANRNAVLTLVAGVSAVILHIRWRRSRRPHDAVPPLLAAGAGLLCGEATLGAVSYIIAFQLTMDGGRWRHRLGALMPYAALVLLWRALYDLLGYGAIGSGLYIDPGRQPLAFLAALAERWPILFAGQWTQVPIDAWALFHRPAQLGMSVVCAVLGLGLLGLLWRLLRRRAEARFWALGMALSLVPVCAAFPMNRLMIHAGVGAFGLLALLVGSVGLLGGDAEDEGRVRRIAAKGLVALHGPVAALLLVANAATLTTFGALFRIGAEAGPRDAAIASQTLVFVNGNEFPVAYTGIMRHLDGTGPPPRRVALLAPMHNDNTVLREDDRTLVVTVHGGMFANAFDRLVRSMDVPFVPGERATTSDFVAEVREVTAAGRPAVIAFTFHAPLEDPSYRWSCWRAEGLVPFQLPAVGESVELPMMPLFDAALVHQRAGSAAGSSFGTDAR